MPQGEALMFCWSEVLLLVLFSVTVVVWVVGIVLNIGNIWLARKL